LQLGLHSDHIQELTRALPDPLQYLDLEGMLRGREGKMETGDWRDGEKKEGIGRLENSGSSLTFLNFLDPPTDLTISVGTAMLVVPTAVLLLLGHH